MSRLAIIESPYAGTSEDKEVRRLERDRNVAYARACLRDSLLRGEAPIASHLLYTQEGVLDDDVPEERQMGIDAGLAWAEAAHFVDVGSVGYPGQLRHLLERTPTASVRAVYTDLGISRGMQYGIEHAKSIWQKIEERQLASFIVTAIQQAHQRRLAVCALCGCPQYAHEGDRRHMFRAAGEGVAP